MRTPWLRIAAAALLVAGVPACAASRAATVTVKASHAWIRVLPGALPAGGYVTLVNTGDTALTLVGASSPDYAHVMLHESTLVDGTSSMHMIKALTLAAHATVRLAPGGYHLMLTQATHPVKPGDRVPITLHFAGDGTLDVTFMARPANAS